MTKTNENKAISTNVLDIKIEDKLGELRSKYDKWNTHQLLSDKLLYSLLEDTLRFYYFVRSDERYEEACKRVLGKTRTNKKLHIATMIAQAVFGKDKKTYAYATALKKAMEAKVGDEGQISMMQYLEENGGVNGVIRLGGSDNAKNNEHYIDVMNNYEKYGLKTGAASCSINDKSYADQLEKGEHFLLHVANNKDGTFTILNRYWDEDEKKCELLKKSKILTGKQLTDTEAYRLNKSKAQKQIEKEKADADKAVQTEIAKIGSSVAKQEKQLAIAA